MDEIDEYFFDIKIDWKRTIFLFRFMKNSITQTKTKLSM